MSRLDTIHRKFLDQLPRKYTPQQEAERQKFFAWLEDLKRKGERPFVAHGALGEEEGRDAFIKEIVRPEGGGVEQSFWGITYRLKLPIQGIKLKNLDMAKSAVFKFPQSLMKLWPVAMGLLCSLIFQRKKFIRTLDRMFFSVLENSVRWNAIEESEYNPASRELKRAAIAVLERDFGFSFKDVKVHFADFSFPEPDGTMAHLLAEITLFVALFLELDTAYRFRVQDAFGTLTETGMARFWKGIETLISRETSQGVGHKWKYMKIVLTLGLALFPDLKKIVNSLMDEVLWINVAMDEADWYFCLRYVSYDFGGLGKAERFAMRDKLDKERGHVIFFA